MKTWKVIIASEANDRMYDHFEFLARVSGTAALRLLETLTEDIKSLETMPFVSPFFDRSYLPKGKYRYKLSYQRYRIVYQIEGDTIYVDDIQDCRQDDDKNLI